MSRIKLAVIFGGMSTEHDVSIVSGTSVLRNLDKSKYEIYPIYINNDGIWNKYKGEFKVYQVGDSIHDDIEKIDNIFEYLQEMDVLFPVLHGLYGEDGSIQGMFELLKIPYVGCKVLGSSIAMDKVYTKIVLEKAGIKQAEYEYIRKNGDKYIHISKSFEENEYSLEQVCELVASKIRFPIFVKPSNSGSSVGINKSKNKEELKEHIEYAAKFDNKILLEEGIVGREIECSVLRE